MTIRSVFVALVMILGLSGLFSVVASPSDGIEVAVGSTSKIKVTYRYIFADTLAAELSSDLQFVQSRAMLDGNHAKEKKGVAILRGNSNPYHERVSLGLVENGVGRGLVLLTDGTATKIYPGYDTTIIGTPSYTSVECLPKQYLRCWHTVPLAGAGIAQKQLLLDFEKRTNVVVSLWEACRSNKTEEVKTALSNLFKTFSHGGTVSDVIGTSNSAKRVTVYSFQFNYSVESILYQRSVHCTARIDYQPDTKALQLQVVGDGVNSMQGFEEFIGATTLLLSASVSQTS